MTDTYANVSVVVPCFRCRETIDRAVASVDKQTVRPLEVILVDDCSGDGTLDYLHKVSHDYEPGWIKVVPLATNVGPGGARNRGWDEASGAYVAFLDADDSWHPFKISLQFGWMQSNPDVALSGHACVVTESGNYPDILNGCARFYPVSSRDALFSNPFSTPTVMVKTNIRHRFLEGKWRSEDYLLWLQILLSELKCAYSDAVLAYLYKDRYGQGGLSGSLWRMEVGELDTYWRLVRLGYINKFSGAFFITYSLLKFFRRTCIACVMRVRRFFSRRQ